MVVLRAECLCFCVWVCFLSVLSVIWASRYRPGFQSLSWSLVLFIPSKCSVCGCEAEMMQREKWFGLIWATVFSLSALVSLCEGPHNYILCWVKNTLLLLFSHNNFIFLRRQGFSGKGPVGTNWVCKHVSAIVHVCEYAYMCIQDTRLLFSNSHRAKT